MAKRFYIAYGSNINISQMKTRCKNAEIVGNGRLFDYELTFKWFATVIPKSQGIVPVLVWKIDEQDEASLDVYEGVSSDMYRKEYISVRLDSDDVIEGLIYILNEVVENRLVSMLASRLPSIQYYFVIREGYIENHLPVDYLDKAYTKAIKGRYKKEC